MDRAHYATGHRAPGSLPRPELTEAQLKARYEQYRRRQAARLVTLIARDAVRPLYRTARARALQRAAFDPKDPARALVELCLQLLPLPPFERWREDLANNPLAHLEDEAWGARPRTHRRSTLTDTRTLAHGGSVWHAALNVYADEDGWRGFIAFHSPGRPASLRTADIFREPTPADVRERFRSFEPHTLEAFLRSVLP